MKIEVQYCQRKADWSIVNALTRSPSRSRRCLLQQESWARVHLLRSRRAGSFPRSVSAKEESPHWWPQRTDQKIDDAHTHLLVDPSASSTDPPYPFLAGFQSSFDNWTVLISTSFVRVACLPHEEPLDRAWKPKESPLAWGRKPQETSDRAWCRVAKKSVRRSNVYDAFASWCDVRLRRVTKTKWRNCHEPP